MKIPWSAAQPPAHEPELLRWIESGRYEPDEIDLLSCFWNSDTESGKRLYDALAMKGEPMLDFLWAKGLIQARLGPRPDAPREQGAAVASAVAALLSDAAASDPTLRGAGTAAYLAGRTGAATSHEPLIKLLISATRHSYSLRGEEAGRCHALMNTIMDALAALPASRIPTFWSVLTHPHDGAYLRPALRLLTDPAATPLLLDALPRLSPDAQSDALIALGNIGDVRAVPVLRQLAGEEDNLLSTVAAEQLRNIQRRSPHQSAQLLRPAGSGQLGEGSLLRPASAGAESSPDELVRGAAGPEEQNAGS